MRHYYTDQEIEQELDSFTNRPPSYSRDMGHPYFNLTDRQFEILLYLLFKTDVEKGKFEGKFDDVSLMTGVGERGRDCELYYRGDKVGLVQCKHSINPTSDTTSHLLRVKLLSLPFIICLILLLLVISKIIHITLWFPPILRGQPLIY